MSTDQACPKKAYEDIDFLKSDYCRPIRLQLEYLKPDVVMRANRVRSTIVIFGSARTLPPDVAAEQLAAAEGALECEPQSVALQRRVAVARRAVLQSRYYALAREFAALVSGSCRQHSLCDFVVITGGGGGIMEAGNRGAADVGAQSIGLNISLPFEQHANPYISPGLSFEFHYFSLRKMHFLMRAKGLAAFPGGFGTMDEVFETLTLIQTGKIEPIPIVLFGPEFWQRVVDWDLLVEQGLISAGDTKLFRVCETAAEAWAFISDFWSHNRERPEDNPFGVVCEEP